MRPYGAADSTARTASLDVYETAASSMPSALKRAASRSKTCALKRRCSSSLAYVMHAAEYKTVVMHAAEYKTVVCYTFRI